MVENFKEYMQKLYEAAKSVSKDSDISSEHSTAEQGKKSAVESIMKKVFKRKKGEDGPGKHKEKEELHTDDTITVDKEKGKEKGGSKDKSFKEKDFDYDEDDDGLKSEDEELDDEDFEDEEDDDDFEFDDFDYKDDDDSGSGESGDDDDDDSKSSSGSGESGISGDDDDDDDTFGDEDMGDEDDYDFGDGSGESAGGESAGEDDDDGEDGDGSGGEGSGDDGDGDDDKTTGHSGKTGKTTKPSSSKDEESSGEGRSRDDGDSKDPETIDDTIDYDSKNDDEKSLEDRIKDAIEQAKDSTKNKSSKSILDKLSDILDKNEGEPNDEFNDELKKSTEDKPDGSDGSGELAGESLDKTPDDESFKEDMKNAGFDDKDIDDMVDAKNEDPAEDVDNKEIMKRAADELEKKCKSTGGSSLARTILRTALSHKVTNMEWKEMVELFLKSKSKTSGNTAKSKSNAWGDKKHLWRDAVLPTKRVSGGEVQDIYCFIDFSGSCSQPLVLTFLSKVVQLCDKLSYTSVHVYGFASELSLPRTISQKDLRARGLETVLNETFDYIYHQGLDGSIENFRLVANEINKIKKKDTNAAVMIFGDGLWGVSYPNPEPPVRLKQICPRHMKDIMCLAYYNKDYSRDGKTPPDFFREEMGYLTDYVGIKHLITTGIDELKE